jgi:Cof subfamily protein (haloacid dehalogenase superfamily)
LAIRLLACDLDGTLIGPGGFGLNTAKQVVQHCESRGVAFTIATGRVFGSVVRYLTSLEVTGPVITNGGALVASLGEEPLWQRTIDPQTARRIAAHLRGLRLPFYFIAGKDMCTEWTGRETREYSKNISFDITVVPCLDDRGLAPTQIAVRVPPDAAGRYVEEFKGAFGQESTVLLSLPHLIEFQAQGVSKASALEFLAHKMGVAREDVLAVGDSLNDLDMLAWAGKSACVGNARPEVAALVGEVAAGRFSEGVLEVVKKAF